ncbi:uncharacterized protein LOC129773020 [Toxorhynchites rutilus septentrionalis]|uniref:uncharacterized protein LOC129773020 n=1 Tax=Toxorhynchites rutilus septentrionalis TaxID=329112 RepID=UPI00247935A1|nr:uncharacterized protein LOC129773020 [Toxorhynchites rutilus septentrionalis]
MSKLQTKRSGDGADSGKTTKWHFFNNMMFIKDQFIPRKTSGNISDVEQHVPSELILLPEVTYDNEIELQESADITETEDSSIFYPSSNTEQPPSTSDIRLPSKRKSSNQKDIALQKIMKLEEEKLKFFKQRTQSPQDDDHFFCLSLAPYLKQLPIHRKMIVRAKFNEILAHEYESQHSGMYYEQQLPLITTPPYHSTVTSSPSQSMPLNEPTQKFNSGNSTTEHYFKSFQHDHTF